MYPDQIYLIVYNQISLWKGSIKLSENFLSLIALNSSIKWLCFQKLIIEMSEMGSNFLFCALNL